MSDRPTHVLVKTTSPRGYFGRAGLRFTREWRPLRLTKDGEQQDLNNGVISDETLARLEGEKEMLAVKPASPDEIAEIEAQQAAGPKDPEAELAALKAKNADLEARLMKLELGSAPAADAGKAKGKGGGEQPAKS